MKLDSVSLTNIVARGFPTNLVKSETPSGTWEVARVLAPGGPKEGEFQLLWEGQCVRRLHQGAGREGISGIDVA
jgi:hypothetical protein